MATPKRNGQASPVIKFTPGGRQVSTFREHFVEALNALVGIGLDDELACGYAGNIAKDLTRKSNCPIASTDGDHYDVQTMSGNANKSRKSEAAEDPFPMTLARAVSRLIASEGLTATGAEKKYGLPPKFLYRLIKEPTPGRAGESIDKVCKTFGKTRREIEDIGA